MGEKTVKLVIRNSMNDFGYRNNPMATIDRILRSETERFNSSPLYHRVPSRSTSFETIAELLRNEYFRKVRDWHAIVQSRP